jgi:hypothetical protein
VHDFLCHAVYLVTVKPPCLYECLCADGVMGFWGLAATLFRAYPGPWQVLLRDPFDNSKIRVAHTQETMPSLKEVALDILPRVR